MRYMFFLQSVFSFDTSFASFIVKAVFQNENPVAYAGYSLTSESEGRGEASET